jgi:putative NIF3 family GTP cyclohydrolase 1 type 2
MKLGKIYRKAVEAGMANDPRGMKVVQRDLDETKKAFKDIKDKDKPYFDEETLKNPYADTRILYGDADTKVKSIIVGVDMETPELLMADRLREKGQAIDLVLAHHPEGRGLVGLADVMALQVDMMADLGVPLHTAEGLMFERMDDIRKKLMPGNQTRNVDAAKLLDMPYACFHTVADNMVCTFLQKLVDEKKPYKLDDIVELLLELPEYSQGKKDGMGPNVLIGSGKRRAGKIYVDMTGGTGGHKNLIPALAKSGVDTIVGMHLGDDHQKLAKENQLNVIIAGHIPSDNVGLNLLFDAILDDDVEVIEASGYRRFKR